MRKIKMHKQDLITCLKQNYQVHRETYLKAREGYRNRVVKELESVVADIKHGAEIEDSLSLPEPEDHSEDYKKSIHLLEICLDDEVLITDEDVKRLVMDEWDWKDRWNSINLNYIH